MNKNGKISVAFARAFHIDPEPRLMKAAKWILEENKQINILALGWDRTGKSKKNEVVDGVNIKRFFAKGEYGKGFKKNILGLILFNLYLLYTFFINKIDVIHACDLDTAIPAIIASKLKRTKLVYDIYDFYSDNRNLGILDPIVRKLELWIIKKAHVVIIADERRISQLGHLSDDILKKIIVIYNTPDDLSINNDNGNTSFLIGYVGVLIPDRRLIEAAKIVSNIENMNISFAGFGPLEKDFVSISNQYNCIKYFGKVSYDRALEIEKQSVAILAMYDPKLPNNRYAAPNKLCEAMMLGKPIITSDGTLCADIVRDEGIGFVIPHEDINAMKDTFIYITQHPDEVKNMGVRARALYDNKYSSNKMKEVLQNAYQQLNI
ncbi:glycosyltransferase involved in cell wall biosynthesis [Sporomusaceae bacterium BoRhaA]|uniref:glycosyltransferase n=1 Tax=Pelorhabdus rhamnosifermentans TaxID=2772457 RepID=UPI001C0605E5|nr:glycosyltransferase [Pelorhabdus rhamnosifermentans]MBU2699042.1 glycosyltransferase involved in cell wall biosynthesis [Pelorhabdus rhamnosifermentans]